MRSEHLPKQAAWLNSTERRSTAGKERERHPLQTEQEVNISAVSISSAIVISVISAMLEAQTPHLLRAVLATYCKEREEVVLASSRQLRLPLCDQAHTDKNQKKPCFYALLATCQTQSAGAFSSRFKAAVKKMT